MLPDPIGTELTPDCVLIVVLAKKIRALTPEADILEIMGQVEELLDRSIATEGYVIRDPGDLDGKPVLDLTQIDFEALQKKFEKGRRHIEAEKLK